MNLFRARPEDIDAAFRLPTPRGAGHDDLPVAEPEGARVSVDATAFALPTPRRASEPARDPLPADVEQQLADLAGVDDFAPAAVATADDDTEEAFAASMPVDYDARLLRAAQVAAVGALAAVATAALLTARYGAGALHVHQIPLALWGLATATSAVGAASLGGDPTTHRRTSHRGAAATVLLTVLLTSVAGVMASAGGLGGPSWVLFFPVVLICGAVLGPTLGLVVGAAAGVGIYAAAGISHTLTVTGAGHLVVILPAAPAAGWAAGALGRLARQAAADAAARRAELERDVRRLAEVLHDVAAGDLTQVPAPGDSADPVATDLAVVFADTLLALRRLVRQMNSVTDQLASSAGQLSATAEQTVAGVEAQTAAVAETTSTVEELAATAAGIAEIAVRVSRFAGSTRRDVEVGVEAVRASGEAMDAIAGRVDALAQRAELLKERIADVGDATRLIDDIARRTTILAVNAAIEAARAGDHGRGFATVAHEVDTLAARARQATGQIGDILGELERHAHDTAVASSEGRAAVEDGVALQDEVVTALRRIAAMVDHTTAASREITEATRQQRFASDAVVAAMNSVTTSSDRYRDGSRGHATAARHMHDLAERLKDTLSRFRAG